jgi:purine-binding chemotaxis protein CheW
MTTQYLTFSVHGEAYGVEVLRVREVIASLPLTRVPTIPPSIRGVVNLRGGVVPVVDLGLRFGQAALAMTKRTCIVLVEVVEDGATIGMGILVDEVNQVIDLDPAAIEPVPQFGVHVRLDFLRGMGAAGEKFVMLLDVDRVLEGSDLRAAATAAVTDAPLPARPQAEPAREPAVEAGTLAGEGP